MGPEVHGLLLQVVQELVGQLLHPDLGVPHGRRRVAVHGAEVPLAVHQWIAEGEVLGHPDDGIVGRRVAVGVILTDHVPDHPGRFLVGLVVIIAHVVHSVEAAAVHRLEPVPHIGEGPADDDAHGIVHVRALHLVFDVDGCLVQGLFKHS